MQTKPRSLVHLAQQPQQRGDGAPPLLLLLHGVGSNEHDLISMAPYLDRRFLILSARAPYNYGWNGYAWFEIGFTGNGDVVFVDPQQIEVSRQKIIQFIGEAIAAYGADPARVYLMGFSQGAIMGSLVALTEPELVAGAVLMSGRVPAEVRPLLAAPERLAGKPFLVVHGTHDQVLPIHNGRASRDLLATLPVDLTYKEYPMEHQVSAESLTDIVAWLAARLDGGRI
jgi:phospholipase/carboxylesterase